MGNHSTLRTLWRFLRPEVEELIAYTIAVVGMFGLALYHVAVQGRIGTDSQGLISSLGDSGSQFLDFLGQDPSWGRFFLFGLWFVIGTVVYFMAWALITLIVDISRDITVSSTFVHPKSFHQSSYWSAIVARGILRAMSGIALVFYGIFWVLALAPVWLSEFELALSSPFSPENAYQVFLTLVGIALTLHIAAILLRIMLLRAHYAYEDDTTTHHV